VKLLERTPGIDQLVAGGTQLPEFDVYAPLMSIAGKLGITLANVPAEVPYVFPAAELLESWRNRLGQIAPGKFKVGINWQGNPKYQRDKYRSMSLAHFAPLADHDQWGFHGHRGHYEESGHGDHLRHFRRAPGRSVGRSHLGGGSALARLALVIGAG
jgi:hypothetical protein